MASRLPTADDLGGLPSIRTGAPIASFDTSVVGEGMAGFGRMLANVGAALGERWDQVEGSRAEAAYLAFKFNEDKAFDEALRSVQPGEARGFADRYLSAYQARAVAFRDGLPPQARDTYDRKLFIDGVDLYNSGVSFEREEQSRAALASLSDTVNQAILPRAEQAARLPAGDPNKGIILDQAIADANNLIDGNPALTPIEKEKKKREVRTIVQTMFAKALTPEEGMTVDPSTGDQTVGERILQLESGGNPTAINDNSSAAGAGQFIESTWLSLIDRYRPDLKTGRSRKEILDLRFDPDLSLFMTEKLADENGRYLKARGYATTPGNLYLAHVLGAAGAINMLAADPARPGIDIDPEAAAANPTLFFEVGPDGAPDLFRPLAAGEVIRLVTGKMQGTVRTDWSRRLDAIPYDQKLLIAGQAADRAVAENNARRKAQADAIDNMFDDLKNGIMDGTRGPADIAAAYDGGRGWLTDPDKRKEAINLYQSVHKDELAFSDTVNKVLGGYDFNPFSADDRKTLDLFYEKSNAGNGAGLLDGDETAVMRLRALVARSDYIPQGAVDTLRPGLWASDRRRRDNAFTILNGLYRENPQAVSRAIGADDLKRLQDYQALAPVLPPDELDKRLNPAQNPQEAKYRQELVDQGRRLASEQLTNDPGLIVGLFDPGFLTKWSTWTSAPVAPLDPLAGQALRDDYVALFAERYAASGDETKARQQAFERLQLKWGVTEIGSGRFIMRYPPEKGSPQIDGSHDWMDQQIDDLVEGAFPKAQAWAPVVLPSTEGDIVAGRPPSYGVVVMDRDGVLQTMVPPEDAAPGWPFDYAAAQLRRTEDFRQRREQQDVTTDQIIEDRSQAPVPGQPEAGWNLPGASPRRGNAGRPSVSP